MLRIRLGKFSIRMPWQAPVILAAILVIVFSVIFVGKSGKDPASAYEGQWGKTNGAEWEAANEAVDWISPDIIYVGHLTTRLTQPLMPDDNIVHVSDTTGFREDGWIKIRSESIYYRSKTRTTFEDCDRSGDIATPVRIDTVVGMLERGYYERGTTEQYTIRYHSGSGEKECEDMWTVETWVDETKAWIPMKSNLVDINTVVLISNMSGDNLKATRYDPEESQIYVEGFKPDSKRVLTVRYQGMPKESWYTIIVRSPDYVFEDYSMPPDGFEKWVTLDTGRSILMNPGDVKDINMSLNIPDDAVVPSQRFMFWVWVAEDTNSMFGNATACTILINMGR